MDEQVGLRGRISLISSLVIESSPNSAFSFGDRDSGGGSSGIIELSRGSSWLGTRGSSCCGSIGTVVSLFN